MAQDMTDFAAGILNSKLDTTTTASVKLTPRTINGSKVSFPTGQFIVYFRYKSRTTTKIEKCNVASGTTNNADGTVTLGTLTRGMSFTDGSDVSGGDETAQSFPAGSEVYLGVGVHILEVAALTNQENSFSAKQSFSGTDHAGLNLINLTTAQRDALSAANGDTIYNTTDGEVQGYVGGAWTSITGGTVANASESAAGKVELSTPAENAAATATGGSGAALVVRTEDCVQASGDAGVAEGAIPVLGASNEIDETLGGTGQVTYTKGDLLAATGASTLVKLGVGSNDQILTADSGEASGIKWASSNVPKEIMLIARDFGGSGAAVADVNDDYSSISLDPTTNEYVITNFVLPSNYTTSATITVQVFWATTNTDTGTVEFDIFCDAVADGTQFDTAYTQSAVTITDNGLGTNNFCHVTAVSSAVTIGGSPAAGGFCKLKIERDATSDTYTGDARFIGALISYT